MSTSGTSADAGDPVDCSVDGGRRFESSSTGAQLTRMAPAHRRARRSFSRSGLLSGSISRILSVS